MVYRKGVTKREHQDGKSSQMMHRPPLNGLSASSGNRKAACHSHIWSKIAWYFTAVIFPSASLGGAVER